MRWYEDEGPAQPGFEPSTTQSREQPCYWLSLRVWLTCVWTVTLFFLRQKVAEFYLIGRWENKASKLSLVVSPVKQLSKLEGWGACLTSRQVLSKRHKEPQCVASNSRQPEWQIWVNVARPWISGCFYGLQKACITKGAALRCVTCSPACCLSKRCFLVWRTCAFLCQLLRNLTT